MKKSILFILVYSLLTACTHRVTKNLDFVQAETKHNSVTLEWEELTHADLSPSPSSTVSYSGITHKLYRSNQNNISDVNDMSPSGNGTFVTTLTNGTPRHTVTGLEDGKTIFYNIKSEFDYTITGPNGTSTTPQRKAVHRTVRAHTTRQYVTVGNNGQALYWDSQVPAWQVISGLSGNLIDVAYGNGTFVILRADGDIYHSTDGQNWNFVNTNMQEVTSLGMSNQHIAVTTESGFVYVQPIEDLNSTSWGSSIFVGCTNGNTSKGVAFVSETRFFVGCGTVNDLGSARFISGSWTTTPLFDGVPGNNRVDGVVYADGRLLAYGEGNNIGRRTVATGTTSSVVVTGIQGQDIVDITPLRMSNGDLYFIGITSEHRIIRSRTNATSNWTNHNISGQEEGLNRVACEVSSCRAVGANTNYGVSTQTGTNWSTLNTLPGGISQLNAIASSLTLGELN